MHIEELRVRGMGGVASADLSFSGNFTVITGESGSGKSSLVRAFEFIAGKRGATSSIHSGSDEVLVEALWRGPGEGETATSRSLARSGKGRCTISGALSTVGQLAEASASMIEIQSQFAQLNLLEASRQLELVDQCGGDELKGAREKLASLFPQMLAAEREIIELKKRKAELEGELEGAPARVRRIKALGLRPGCEKEWTDELAAVERQIAESGRYEELIARMKGGEAEVDILDQVEAILRELYTLAPEESAERWSRLGESALSSLHELFAGARAELNMIPREELESRREILEEKIGALRKVKRETGLHDADELLGYLDEVDREMAWLKESATLLDEKNKRAATLRTEVGATARTLRALRERAAADFQQRVNRHLSDLAMEDVRFSVAVQKLDRIRVSGAETVSFMLQQKDLPPLQVSRAASGGELSRILIAIQASIEPSRLPGTIVFDEVEAGLGGRTALLAGEKLREISRNCRMILITHEATIAAMADQHFLVRRTGDETEIAEITGGEREAEIARMLSGSDSREALEHARSLLKEV